MTHTWNRPLFAAVAVAAFTAWALVPPDPPSDPPREGRVLVYLDLTGVGPGETHRRDFTVNDLYDTMELSYNISRAAHVRASVTGPDGTRQDSTQHPERDEITLVIDEPEPGAWTFEVRTLQDDTDPGYILSGNFTMLGFGGTLRVHPAMAPSEPF